MSSYYENRATVDAKLCYFVLRKFYSLSHHYFVGRYGFPAAPHWMKWLFKAHTVGLYQDWRYIHLCKFAGPHTAIILVYSSSGGF